jgi:hypothetical protein
MNLRETILSEHSKATCNKIVHWVGNSQQRFDELFRLFLNDEDVVKQRAAWPLSYAVMAHPDLIRNHIDKLLKNLQKPKLHTAIKRNSIRLLAEIEIPEKFHGRVMSRCFDYLVDPAEAVVVKVYSMMVLQNFSKQYPEIKQELKTIIEERWAYETGAFRSRGKKILKAL